MASSNIWDITPPNAFTQPTVPTAPVGGTAPTSGTNPWFNGGNYGQSQDWFNTPISQNIREDNQRLAFNAWGARQGVSENDNTFNRWFQEQFPRFQSGYGQATLYNPTMNIDQFIQTLPGMTQLRNQYNAQSPAARGAQFGAYAPNARWVPR